MRINDSEAVKWLESNWPHCFLVPGSDDVVTTIRAPAGRPGLFSVKDYTDEGNYPSECYDKNKERLW